MDLLQEAKKSNKQAFNELVQKYNHIFYKAARIYFISDKDIYPVIESSLSEAFREIVNAKDERDFLCFSLKILLSNCDALKKKFAKDINKKINSKQLAVNIGDKIAISETNLENDEYQAYRKTSVVEEYITSIEEQYRVIALLYYYANLTPAEISNITKEPESTIKEKLGPIRIKIYEMIKNKEVDL